MIKTARRFVAAMADDDRLRAVIRAAVERGRALGRMCAAAGDETSAHAGTPLWLPRRTARSGVGR